MSESEDYYMSKGTRVPTFDGDKAKWPFYKKKLESYLARSGLSELFSSSVGDNVKKDSWFPPPNMSDAAKEEVKRIQKMNQKAAGILLNSILTETEKGQSVFYLIEKFHDAGAGFAGGQFYKEWTALTKRYEEVEAKSIADLKKEYYSAKMEDEQQPSLFIVKMERLKIKMEEKGYKIDKDEFLRDILHRSSHR